MAERVQRGVAIWFWRQVFAFAGFFQAEGGFWAKRAKARLEELGVRDGS